MLFRSNILTRINSDGSQTGENLTPVNEQQQDTHMGVFDLHSCPVSFPDVVVKNAKADWAGIIKGVRSSKCRRTAPDFALPNEIWRMFLGIFKLTEGAGIGYQKEKPNFRRIKQMLFQFLCVMRWTKIAPMSWHHSHAFSLPKKEQSSVAVAFDAQRTIHTLDAFGKSFISTSLTSLEPKTAVTAMSMLM